MPDVDGRMVVDAPVPLDVQLTLVLAVTVDDVTLTELMLCVKVVVDVMLALGVGSSVHGVEEGVVLLVQENVVGEIEEVTTPFPVKLDEVLITLMPVPVPKVDVVLGSTEEELLVEVEAIVVEVEISVHK